MKHRVYLSASRSRFCCSIYFIDTVSLVNSAVDIKLNMCKCAHMCKYVHIKSSPVT